VEPEEQAEWFAGSGWIAVNVKALGLPAAKEVEARYPRFKIAAGNKIREVWKSGVDAVALYCAKYLNKDLASGDVIFTDELLRERTDFQLPLGAWCASGLA
jgi:hypothetical protein